MSNPDDIGVALRMKGVSKQYLGTLAVDNVDFEVRVGEVHALMGENGAGKSTLMKILAGSFNDYTGSIFIGQKEVALHSPAVAKAHGIGMIYQELNLARPISIAENLLVGRLPREYGVWLDRKAMVRQASRLLDRVGLDLDPLLPVEAISQHQAQLVEIAKVLGSNPCVLVMDEPTSALSRDDVGRLFEIIRQLKNRGITIIYISHHLPEVFEIADRITVLRDGRKIDTKYVGEVTPAAVVQMMVAQTIDEFYTHRTPNIGAPVLDVRNLTRKGFFHDVSFQARRGEILGVAGLTGAGRTEVARSMCGLDPVDGGTVEMAGSKLGRHSYAAAMEQGLLYLSEDRKTDGLFLRLPVKQNMVSAIIRRYTRCGIYSSRHETSTTEELIKRLDIIAASMSTEVSNLSGGNQQKVLLGKWIAANPTVLVLDEPSRGVDIKAKMKIHKAVMELAENGRTIILISSDLAELVGLSDRVIVMRDGHLIGEMQKGRLSEDAVLLAMNGQLDETT
ncbi:MAG TPA: sugar ABC transporter ATP-binding protein [Sedimentisphaerales bacterium]|nr:sugar ABC transporter ATP-binding protein [Sedimentisphaerales bacterium]